MKKFKTLILLLTVALILFSCMNGKNNSNCTVINIKDAKEIGRKHVLDDIIEKIEFIPLDFNEEFPIGYTNLITAFKNRFYICDQSSSTIHVFDEEGNYIDLFRKHGRGPGEILELKSFFIHENFNLSILTYQKIVTYDENFNFINSFKIPDKEGQVVDFTFINETSYALFNDLVEKSNIVVFEKDKLISEYGNVKARDTQKRRFYKYGNIYNIIPLSYSNSILALSDNSRIFEKYKLIIKKQDIKALSKLKSNSPSDLIHYGINDFFETQKYIYGSYGNAPVKSFLYSKIKKECIKSEMGVTQIGGFMLPLPVHNVTYNGNDFIGVISSMSIQNFLKELKPNRVLSDTEIEKIKNRDIADNPIIVKIKLKS